MDEETAKGILHELKKRRVKARNRIQDVIGDAEIRHDYKGKWAIWIMLKNQNTGIYGLPYDRKEMAEISANQILKGQRYIRFSDHERVPTKEILMAIAIPVKG